MANNSSTPINKPTSIKLSSDLRQQAEEFIFIRRLTLRKLVEESIQHYLQHHPLTPEEIAFIRYRQRIKKSRQ